MTSNNSADFELWSLGELKVLFYALLFLINKYKMRGIYILKFGLLSRGSRSVGSIREFTNTVATDSEIGSTKSTVAPNVLTEKAAPIIIKEVEMPKLSVNVNVRSNPVRFQSPKKAEVRAALRNVNDLHGANSDMNYNSFARSMISRFVNGAPAFDLYNSESYVGSFANYHTAFGIFGAWARIGVERSNSYFINFMRKYLSLCHVSFYSVVRSTFFVDCSIKFNHYLSECGL